MEMLSSFRGDKHEFCLVVITLKHVRSCFHVVSTSVENICEHPLCHLTNVIFSLYDVQSASNRTFVVQSVAKNFRVTTCISEHSLQ